MGVRGVPGQRYYGKVKAFGNLETRVHLFDFHLFGAPLALGTAVFFDGGRVWTEIGHAHPDLDGTALGLKYGIGGGLRLIQGTTFVIRGDLAWSPDAHPIGGYFAAGEVF
jgi:hemolysin activation/secretion protein